MLCSHLCAPAPEGRVVTGIRPPEHNITKAAALPLVNRTAPGILSSDVATVVLVRTQVKNGNPQTTVGVCDRKEYRKQFVVMEREATGMSRDSLLPRRGYSFGSSIRSGVVFLRA